MQSQEFRLNPDSMRRIYVRPSSGEMVPLSAIVDVMVHRGTASDRTIRSPVAASPRRPLRRLRNSATALICSSRNVPASPRSLSTIQSGGGAFSPRAGHHRRKGCGVDADGRKRQRADLSFLSDMRLHCLLGERRLSWIRRCCYRQLRRPKFPRADYRGVGGVTPLLVLLAAQHAAQARGEAGVIKQPTVFR